MCNALQAGKLNVSGAIEEMKTAYSALNGIRNNTEDSNNEVVAAQTFAKFMDINCLADFNKVHRRGRKPKRLDENPDSTFILDIYQYYAKEIIAVFDPMLSALIEKYEKSSFKPFFDVLDPKKATESTDDGSLKKLGPLYPKEIPDILALNAELEVFWDYLTEKMDGKEINTRMAADFGIQSHLKMGLFPSVARLYRVLKTAPRQFAK